MNDQPLRNIGDDPRFLLVDDDEPFRADLRAQWKSVG